MKYTKTLLAIAAMLALTVSCSDEEYFDKEAYDKLITSAFPISDVDPDHDWQTIGSADVQITLMQSEEGQSTIRIYDGEPSESGTSMLAKQSLSNGETMKTSINYPIANPNVVISLTDPDGYRGYYYRTIEDGQLITNVGDQMVETTKATRASATRSTVTGVDYTFMNDYNGGVYPTSYSSDAIEYSGSMSESKNYYFTPTSATLLKDSKLETKKNTVVYLTSGDYDLTISSMAENSTLVLLDGANLTMSGGELKGSSSGVKIIVCSGAKITRSGQITLTKISLYSQGAISSKADFKLTSGSEFYNGGTLDVDKVSIEDISQLVNTGTIKTGVTLTVNGAFWNIGTTTCGSNCVLDFANDTTTKKNVFVNDGYLKAVQFRYCEGKVGQVLNSCKIEATTGVYLDLNNSTFNLNAGASVKTPSLETNQEVSTYINMGANSIIDATTIEPKNSTITGPSDGYALIKTTKFDGGSKSVSLQGRIYVDVKNDYWYNFEYVTKGDYIKRFDPGNAKLDITQSECSAGYTGKPDETTAPETSSTLRYCYEDNFPKAGDYDFNDVVLDITPEKVDSKTVKYNIKLVAVGATKQLAAALHLDGVSASAIIDTSGIPSEINDDYNSQAGINSDMIKKKFTNGILASSVDGNSEAVLYLFNDAHYVLNNYQSTNTGVYRPFINTVLNTEDTTVSYHNPGAKEWTITVQFSEEQYVNKALQEAYIDPFVINDYNGGYWEIHTTKWQGKSVLFNYGNANDYDINRPWAICVPGSFQYPREFYAIGTYDNGKPGGAYPTVGHSFGEWCKNRYQATDWYNYPDTDLVYSSDKE